MNALAFNLLMENAPASAGRADRPRERRWNEVIHHSSLLQCGGRANASARVEVSNVVIKVAVEATPEGVCRLSAAEMVLEISDVMERAKGAREAGRPSVRGTAGRLEAVPGS